MLLKNTLKFMTHEVIVLTVIFINAVIMVSLETNPTLPKTIGTWILWVDFACVLYFALELVVKWSDLGTRGYFTDNWNKLDFLIVILSLPVLIEPFLSDGIGWLGDVAILRLARFLRLWRIIRYVYTSDTYKCLRVPVIILIVLTGTTMLIDGSKDLISDSYALIKQVLNVMLVLSLTFLIVRMLRVLFSTFFHRKLTKSPYNFDSSLVDFIALITIVLTSVNGIMIAISTSGHDPFALLAGLGIGGMAIAFAAQDAVANIIAGIMLLVQKPFRTGDWISISGKTGAVHHIGLRCTVLEEFGGEHLTFPNKVFMDNPVRNIDKRGFYLLSGSIRLHHQTKHFEINDVIDMVKKICAEHPELYDDCGVRFEGFGEACFPISFWMCVKEWSENEKLIYRDRWEKIRVVEQDFYIKLVEGVNEKEIMCAMPIREMLSEQQVTSMREKD